MDDTYEPAITIMCKKCGQQHSVENYRTLLFYICPVVNRVLLVSEVASEQTESDH